MRKLPVAAFVFATALSSAAWATHAAAAVKVQTVDYQQGGTTLEGWLVYDDAKHAKRPGVVIFPSWNGPTDEEKGRA